MRPSSPLSLLLFLQFSTAFPVDPRTTSQSQKCLNSPSCSSLRSAMSTLSFSLSHPKPSDPRNPHFPEHQKQPLVTFVKPTTTSSSSSDEGNFAHEGAFDNAPMTPSKDISANEALSAEAPLSTAYLQSLTKTVDEDEARPSMPTSALPSLRKEDARRYWEEESGKKSISGEKPDCGNSKMWHGTAVGYRSRMTHFEMGSRNDFMVVGIVVIFLFVVFALEVMDRVGNRNSKRGEIFLEDDETYAFIVKKPRHFLERESRCKCAQVTEFKEYKDDETVVAEDFNGDAERKI
ncbi:predicted protein [Sclerotinia sclerotiorum 1980 UF-70]|uniref:Copper transporter n=2 Tax=Sclerotinia sclerotiorum (strain ATCC 18683 / 1980 / Ss-1) TaxID=665079 RepID=A0A1D9Q1V5_SCLS1|nr:predicted protein [Sclerotinia sclerotiorum 1980 UF-70]APA08859.1 hypothetical protein sscle_04g036290 [Sclerotinia sclerotiorum 1980 UF-70]EDN99809.1 predicted protein [Sclerotinia sclerotiorum 1980 UF-70]